jgi:HK97 family phage portal protein
MTNRLLRSIRQNHPAQGHSKGLYELHPELFDRQPIMRVWSDDDKVTAPGFESAAKNYNQHIWTNKAVRVIADNFSQIGIRVVGGDDEEEVAGHQVTALFEHANETMSQADLWREWVVNMLLGGECGQELVRGGGENGPYREVWNRDADTITVRVDREQKHYGGITGYKIDYGHNEKYDVPPDELVFHKFYNPTNRWRGVAPIHAVRMGILIDEFSQAWSRLLFKNAVRPDVVVMAPQGLTTTEREEMEVKLSKRYGGLDRSHLPIVMEEGIQDIKPISYPPKDTQWLEQRKFARDEVAAVFGVPDEMMGYGRDTYENFGQALRVLWSLTLAPLIRLRDDKLTTFFRNVNMIAPAERVLTDMSQVDALQEDQDRITERAMRLVERGWPLNLINEVFGLGLGEVEGGNYGYLPLSMVPVTRIPGTPEPEPPNGSGNEERSIAGSNKGVAYESAEHKALWLLFKARTETRERVMVRILKRAFQRQQDALNEVVRSRDEISGLNVDMLLDWDQERQAWADEFKGYITETVKEGGLHGLEQLGMVQRSMKLNVLVDFDITNPLVLRAIELILWDFTDEVTATTQAGLLELIRQSASEGWTIPQLSDAIAELYTGFKDARSTVIARTETIKAFNLGTHHSYGQAGVEKRGWLAALDDRTREAHVQAHLEYFENGVDIDQPFIVMDEPLWYPGDPNGSPENVIQCRCSLVPVIDLPGEE